MIATEGSSKARRARGGRPFRSLRSKFLRTLLLVTGLIGASALAIVVILSVQASSRHLSSVQTYIEEGITSKGRVLTENHALALRSLTLDNAFLDMQRLVERATREDADVLYGLYIGSELQTLAYSRPGPRGLAGEAPARDAWRELGLSESNLVLKRPGVLKVKRLGQDVLEFSAPVWGEDDELVGTIRYGVSTRRMQDALARAGDDARERLLRSVVLIGSLITLAVGLVLLLSRAQAVRITRPVGELTVAAGNLATGDRLVRVNIDSGDELEQLGASFNRMVHDLDASYRYLEEMNRTLELKVRERTAELAHKNRDMRLVLDNVDQGFATLSSAGIMAAERSRVLGEWFGDVDGALSFWEYAGRISPSFGEEFKLAWQQILDDFLPLDVCLSQLPARLSRGQRTWSLRYLPFFNGERLEGVLVGILEITERLAKEKDDAEQQELMHAFRRLVADREGFVSFFREANEMVSLVCSRELDVDLVAQKRVLHTLKGTSASMDLNLVTGLCHALEEELESENTLSDAGVDRLAARFQRLRASLESFGAKLDAGSLEVSAEEYAGLLSELSNGDQGGALERAHSWRLESVEKPFARLADQARCLSRRLNKGELAVEVQANGIRVDHDRFAPFFAELGHVVRNAVDHGIETPEERRAGAKLGPPRLTLQVRASSSELTFEIADDGRGIDWPAIAAQARERGLAHEGHEALLDALCHDGVTTRPEVTETSGRGVGMAALKQRVVAMHGRLDVLSVRGDGTRWTIRIPRRVSDGGLARGRRASSAPRTRTTPRVGA